MPKSVYAMLAPAALLALLLAVPGCGPGGDKSQDANNPPAGGPAPGPMTGGAPPGGNGPGANSKIREIMGKVARGPMSLTPMIGNELKADPPEWGTIQGQTKEYSQLAAELGKDAPPRGSSESWAKLSSAFADSAAVLDHAAEAKDRDAALAAHKQLTGSCDACHREHRPMRGPGGPGGSGGPPGHP